MSRPAYSPTQFEENVVDGPVSNVRESTDLFCRLLEPSHTVVSERSVHTTADKARMDRHEIVVDVTNSMF